MLLFFCYNQSMKKLSIFLAVILPLCACTGMSSYDGNSTKQWIYIESSKQDLEGKTIDVCYRFDVRFSPEEATQRFDTDKACITKCCWYSESKKIAVNLNMDFAKELAEEGTANKYTVDTLLFTVRYSNLLNTIHATVKPSSVLRNDGLIRLDYTTVNNDKGLLKIDLGDLKVKDYSEEDDGHKGTYLYENEKKAMEQRQADLEHLREMAEYQRVDTGLTPTKEPLPEEKAQQKEESVLPQEQVVIPTTPTVINTLQTQPEVKTSKVFVEEQSTVKKTLKETPLTKETTVTTVQASIKETAAAPVKEEEKPQFVEQENVFYNTEVYNLNDPVQRQKLLEQKLAYERTQAVALLKRFYEQNIDEYIRLIDKQQAAKGYVLLANDREWKTTKIGYPIYRVNCNVKGKLGKTKNNMKSYPIPCGIYEVDLDEKTVLPRDVTAITIVNKDYKY